MDTILDEKSDIGISAKEPEKLGDDSLPVDFLRREEWESITELEAKLSSEKTLRDVTTSKIFVIDTIFDEIATEIEILLFWMESHSGID